MHWVFELLSALRGALSEILKIPFVFDDVQKIPQIHFIKYQFWISPHHGLRI